MKSIYIILIAYVISACNQTSNTANTSLNENEASIKEVSGITARDKESTNNESTDGKQRQTSQTELGLKEGEQETFYATDSIQELDYVLTVMNIGNDSLQYKFQTISRNDQVKELTGKLKLKKRTRTHVTKRYYTTAQALIYSASDEKSETSLVIETQECDFVRIYHFRKDVDMIRYGEIDPKIIGIKYLSMAVRNPSNDFKAYFKSMVDELRESFSAINHTDTSSNQYPERLKTYNSNLSIFSKLIAEYQASTTDYDLQNDSTLLNRISLAELDSAKKMLQKIGIDFKERVLPENDQFVPIGFQDALVVDLLMKHPRRFTKFYRMKFTDNLGYGNLKFEEGLYKMYAKWDDFFKYDSLYVGLLSSFGFETVDFTISLWEPERDSLKLKEILDQTISVDIGGVKIDTVVSDNNFGAIFIGTKSGGDAGDVWGGFWVAHRTEPYKLETVIEKNYSGNSENYETVNYTFLNDSIIELESVIRIWKDGGYRDSLLSTESLNLRELIGDKNKIQ